MSKRSSLAIAVTIALVFAACASDPRSRFENAGQLAARDEAPFGGEALAQRKLELQRAVADVGDLLETLTSMKDRDDEYGIELFRKFVDRYLVTHVGPLLAPQWQSRHPELIRHDANLRFVQSELLIELAYKNWARDEIDDLRNRYKERGNMLVEYPIGQQTTLREALSTLRAAEANS